MHDERAVPYDKDARLWNRVLDECMNSNHVCRDGRMRPATRPTSPALRDAPSDASSDIPQRPQAAPRDAYRPSVSEARLQTALKRAGAYQRQLESTVELMSAHLRCDGEGKESSAMLISLVQEMAKTLKSQRVALLATTGS